MRVFLRETKLKLVNSKHHACDSTQVCVKLLFIRAVGTVYSMSTYCNIDQGSSTDAYGVTLSVAPCEEYNLVGLDHAWKETRNSFFLTLCDPD